MYFDYHLEFDSEEQAHSVLFDSSTGASKSNYFAVDLIGFIDFEQQEDGQVLPRGKYLANVRSEQEQPELLAFESSMNPPYRVWG